MWFSLYEVRAAPGNRCMGTDNFREAVLGTEFQEHNASFSFLGWHLLSPFAPLCSITWPASPPVLRHWGLSMCCLEFSLNFSFSLFLSLPLLPPHHPSASLLEFTSASIFLELQSSLLVPLGFPWFPSPSRIDMKHTLMGFVPVQIYTWSASFVFQNMSVGELLDCHRCWMECFWQVTSPWMSYRSPFWKLSESRCEGVNKFSVQGQYAGCWLCF